MNSAKTWGWSLAALAIAAAAIVGLLGIGSAPSLAQQNAGGVAIDNDDIGGVVSSAAGPEGGVWVIAETDALKTRFAKVVVTDDRGRFVVPDLPAADYRLWVRGYGLVDSAKVDAKRGTRVNLTATAAPNDAAAAQIYPAIYWFSMMHLPTEAELAGLPGGLNRYLAIMKNEGCVGCHQLGNKYTRTTPELFSSMAPQDAWARRIQSGQAGTNMIGQAGVQLRGLPIKYLADWGTRIARGELPASKPPRPAGMERNIVATIWDWSNEKAYLHDLTGTDWRNPTVNANGPLYGAPELSTDEYPILDPNTNTATTLTALVRDADTPVVAGAPLQPSPVWGAERIWTSKTNSHNPIMDQKGRVWYTAIVRAPNNNPAFCKAGSDHPSAKLFPMASSGRQLSVYDPKTQKWTLVDTCFSTQHLRFAEDASNTLWTSNDRAGQIGETVGWLNTKMFDETGDAARSQGWTALVLDTNGNGKRDEGYVGPNDPVDPTKDKRIIADFYAVMPNPADGSVWGSWRLYPERPEQVGAIIRLNPGPNPPATALVEIYNIPLPGFGIRGSDIDRNGVVWAGLASGHLASFDRRKCKGPLNGPKATGDQCPEGWSFYPMPGPGFPELPQNSAESSYYTFVDQQNVSGLGANTPIITGNLYDGVHAFVGGKWVTMRIPYPLGFFQKGFEGRIDNPRGGWKGRALWVPSGDRTPWHQEGGKGSKPLVVKFQVRPNPLAK